MDDAPVPSTNENGIDQEQKEEEEDEQEESQVI
jgi:hypothetical protein